MYQDYLKRMDQILNQLIVTDGEGKEMPAETGFQQWADMSNQLKVSNAAMYMAGNGASAMMASHMAADASKNGQIRARTFNDAALLTAVGNDLAYDEVFSMPLMRFGDAQDVLVTISSSGNSPNIIRGIEQARTLGMHIVTLSGMKPDNRSRSQGDLNFYVPGPTYGLVECAHQIVLHYWLDLFITQTNSSAPASLTLPNA